MQDGHAEIALAFSRYFQYSVVVSSLERGKEPYGSNLSAALRRAARAPDRQALYREIVGEIQARYPDHRLRVLLDADVSD